MDAIPVELMGYLTMAAALIFFVSFFIGKATTTVYRCKLMRQFLKKNYVLLRVIQMDMTTVQEKVVNIDDGSVEIAGHIWGVEKNMIFRQEDSQDVSGDKFPKDKNGNRKLPRRIEIKLSKEQSKYSEGVPVYYVHLTDLGAIDWYAPTVQRKVTKSGEVYTYTPMNWKRPANSAVASNELSSIFTLKRANDKARALSSVEQLAKNVTICMILAGMAMACSGYAVMKILDVEKGVQANSGSIGYLVQQQQYNEITPGSPRPSTSAGLPGGSGTTDNPRAVTITYPDGTTAVKNGYG